MPSDGVERGPSTTRVVGSGSPPCCWGRGVEEARDDCEGRLEKPTVSDVVWGAAWGGVEQAAGLRCPLPEGFSLFSSGKPFRTQRGRFPHEDCPMPSDSVH